MCVRISSLISVCFLCSVWNISCTEDNPDHGPALTGRWEIVKGFRNEKETGTLTGTYFQFNADGKMVTNLPICPEELAEFELNKNSIRQQCTPPVTYEIQALSDTSLVLGLEMRGMQFTMHFERAIDSVPVQEENPLQEEPTSTDTLSGAVPADSSLLE